jgi:hypothetical protein
VLGLRVPAGQENDFLLRLRGHPETYGRGSRGQLENKTHGALLKNHRSDERHLCKARATGFGAWRAKIRTKRVRRAPGALKERASGKTTANRGGVGTVVCANLTKPEVFRKIARLPSGYLGGHPTKRRRFSRLCGGRPDKTLGNTDLSGLRPLNNPRYQREARRASSSLRDLFSVSLIKIAKYSGGVTTKLIAGGFGGFKERLHRTVIRRSSAGAQAGSSWRRG